MDDVRGVEGEPLLTPREVADILGVNPKTVARWAEQGKLPALRTLGGRRRFRRSDVNDAIAKANSEGEAAPVDGVLGPG